MELLARDEEKMRVFAEALARDPDHPFKAAKKVFPALGDLNLAMVATAIWPSDPFVVAYIDKLRQTEPMENRLPSKETVALEIWRHVQDETASRSERLASLRFYSELMGYTSRSGGLNVNVNTQVNNKTLVVPAHGNDEEWERGLAAHQARLTAQNASAE